MALTRKVCRGNASIPGQCVDWVAPRLFRTFDLTHTGGIVQLLPHRRVSQSINAPGLCLMRPALCQALHLAIRVRPVLIVWPLVSCIMAQESIVFQPGCCYLIVVTQDTDLILTHSTCALKATVLTLCIKGILAPELNLQFSDAGNLIFKIY